MLDRVLEPSFLRTLDRLRLNPEQSVTLHPGNTPVRRGSQPAGMELTNYKEYAPGDDPRHVDWNAYGRFNTLWIKRFRAERQAPLHLLIDVSASMQVPARDGKLPFAAAIAASLSYISLRHQDPVRFVALARGGATTLSPLYRHIGRFPEIRSFLRQLQTNGASNLADGVDAYLRTTQLPGVAVVLSDFLLAPEHWQRALDGLRSRGRTVAALRVIGPEERDPAMLPRRVRLHDVEAGSERLITLTAAHRAQYATALEAHLSSLKRWCDARGVVFVAPETDRGIEHCLFAALPHAGLLH